MTALQNSQMAGRALNSDAVTEAWDDAHEFKAQIEAAEAERGKPVMIHAGDWQVIVTLTIAFLMGCTLGGLWG